MTDKAKRGWLYAGASRPPTTSAGFLNDRLGRMDDVLREVRESQQRILGILEGIKAQGEHDAS